MTTRDTISNNLRQYEDYIAPHGVPNGGGYSITCFTLGALYQLFERGRCWWTSSNADLPLIRYTGAKFTLYRSESSDYIVTTHNCYPMQPTIETYNSIQPTIMQLNRKHKIVKCKRHNKLTRPYKILRSRPPSQFINKWYFQKDIVDEPLLMLFCTSCSLDRWYLGSTSISTSTGFTGLNPDIFHYHNWQQQTTQGYHPKDGLYMFSVQQSTVIPKKIQDINIVNIIYLGATGTLSQGTTIGDYEKAHRQSSFTQTLSNYFSQHGYWGNIFTPFYLSKNTSTLIYSFKHPRDWYTKYTSNTDKLKPEDFNFFTSPLLVNYRYNPFPDDGIQNQIYLKSIKDLSPSWDAPPDKHLNNNNLPLWLGLWGLLDFHKNTPDTQDIDTNYIIVLKTKHITPQTSVIIPIDQDFLEGQSPYRKPPPIPADQNHWYPKTYWQHRTLNDICQTGPGVLKLPSNVSAEAHVRFKLYFKLGGCAQPLKQIKDPELQPTFPTPNNMLRSTSLQSPETPIQHYLYNFDWRRHFLTQAATERITKYISPKKTFPTSTGLNLFNFQRPPQESPETSDEETTEKEKQALQQLIIKHHRKQQRFRQQILQLLTSQNIE